MAVTPEGSMNTDDASTTTGQQEPPDWWPFQIPISPTIPPDAETDRQNALDAGRIHQEVMDAIERLAEENGGGVLGAARGAMAECERRGRLTSADHARLRRVLDALSEGDAATANSTIVGIFEEAAADPDSTPLALTVCSIAAANATAAETDEESSHTAGMIADVAAPLLAGPGAVPLFLPLSVGASVIANHVAAHVHVEVTIH